MYSLKYGTLPIAYATSGLHQIIQDFDPTTRSGNGFLFYNDTPEALWDGISRARILFAKKEDWAKIVQRAMASNFTWELTAHKYEQVYEKITL